MSDKEWEAVVYIIGNNKKHAINKLIHSKKYKIFKNKHKNFKLSRKSIKYLCLLKELEEAEIYEFGPFDIAIFDVEPVEK